MHRTRGPLISLAAETPAYTQLGKSKTGRCTWNRQTGAISGEYKGTLPVRDHPLRSRPEVFGAQCCEGAEQIAGIAVKELRDRRALPERSNAPHDEVRRHVGLLHSLLYSEEILLTLDNTTITQMLLQS